MIGIYKITSPTKKVYIGQSINIKERITTYKRNDCKPQKALYSSLLKYGFDKHKFEILELCDIEQLNEKERYYQDLYQSISKNGLNLKLTTTKDRSGKLSEETKKRIGQSQIGKKISNETKEKISKANKGRILSEENRIKLINSNLGKKLSTAHRLKLLNINLGKILSDKTKEKISKAKKGKTIVFSEEHKKKLSEFLIKKNKECKKKCASLDENGNIIKTFNSLKEASEHYNTTSLSKAIKNNWKQKGVRWKYID